ncbi:MAG: leucine-rich repeat domain-containing protein [Promethearchaeota archaeon]
MSDIEKYENVELLKEEVEALKDLEKYMGVPLPHIEKIAWDDFRIDEQTHQVEKFRQHQFGFISEDYHVVALGLSFQSINEKKMQTPNFMPSLSKFTHLKALDINSWKKVFAMYIEEHKRRQEAHQKSITETFLTIEERRKAQEKARRELYMPISGPSHADFYNQLKKLENLEYLDASNCDLESIPPFGSTKKLQELDLSQNNIKVIKEGLDGLENLCSLNLSKNPISECPADLEKIKLLKILDLSETDMKELPEHVGNLQYLEELTLPLQISGFPQSFIHLKNLKTLVANGFPDHFKELKTLETLIISSGKMQEISKALTELTALNTLIINNCRSLKKLPENLGNLKSLQHLQITGNMSLEKLPDSLFELERLRTLNLYNNNLKNFPDKLADFPYLEILTLGNNKLEYLPYSVFKLKNLIDFTIENNPLELNDKLISAKTLPEIKEYSKKKMAISVFISHAVADYEPCRLKELGAYLEAQLEVDIAYLCERDLSGNINGFMDKFVPKSQLVLFIATPNSVNSKDCGYELQLSREYGVQVVPIKAKELDWGDLTKIGLNRELGMECDFNDKEKFDEFCTSLYDYIKQLKRQIDLHDREQGKIDRLTVGLKMLERKVESLESKINALENKK